MREIVLDTETTGFDPNEGDRIVEIGCIELINHIPTENVFHRYINPERDMPESAFKVHGLSEEFLRGHKVIAEEIDEFLEFIGESKLVIHNAQFDMKFLNAELARLNRPTLPMTQSIDTVSMARRKFPGAQANLDALCRRFGIDNSARTKHGALLDAELLAEVYLELIGGRQRGLSLEEEDSGMAAAGLKSTMTGPPFMGRALSILESSVAAPDIVSIVTTMLSGVTPISMPLEGRRSMPTRLSTPVTSMVPETVSVSVSNITSVLSPTRPIAGAAATAEIENARAAEVASVKRNM